MKSRNLDEIFGNEKYEPCYLCNARITPSYWLNFPHIFRFIESMCQTIMAVDELLWVINNQEIDCNLKKPFLRYFLWVYMKTAGSAVESGAGDLPHDMSVHKLGFFCSLIFCWTWGHNERSD